MKLNSESNGKGRDTDGRASPPRGQSSLSRARSQLSQAVGGVLSGSLGALEGRLGPSGWRISFGSGGSANAERLRDVVQRDRALFAANPRPKRERTQAQDAPATVPAVTNAATEDPDAALSDDVDLDTRHATTVADAERTDPAASTADTDKRSAPRKESGRPKREPIRTRTMARLLAAQGHKGRALSIYDELIAADASDATLIQEAASLRETEA
jgi:hypothetical protein